MKERKYFYFETQPDHVIAEKEFDRGVDRNDTREIARRFL